MLKYTVEIGVSENFSVIAIETFCLSLLSRPLVHFPTTGKVPRVHECA